MAATVAGADVCTTAPGAAPSPIPKLALTFDRLPLASCCLSPQEAGRWINVINPLLKYAGSPGDWGRDSKLGLLTIHLLQARAEMLSMAPEGVLKTTNASFVHEPRPPMVGKDHPDQRRFGRTEYGNPGMRLPGDRDASMGVYRNASHDVAQFSIQTGSEVAVEIRANLKPTELRAMAQMLLDAAHDIDTNPSTLLLAELAATRGAA